MYWLFQPISDLSPYTLVHLSFSRVIVYMPLYAYLVSCAASNHFIRSNSVQVSSSSHHLSLTLLSIGLHSCSWGKILCFFISPRSWCLFILSCCSRNGGWGTLVWFMGSFFSVCGLCDWSRNLKWFTSWYSPYLVICWFLGGCDTFLCFSMVSGWSWPVLKERSPHISNCRSFP